MSDVVEITNLDDFEEFTFGDKVVIDFARRYGCNPCRQLEPHFAMAATKLKEKGYRFAKIMLDEVEPEFLNHVLDELNIRSTPTVLFYSYGALQREVSARNAPLIIKELGDHDR